MKSSVIPLWRKQRRKTEFEVKIRRRNRNLGKSVGIAMDLLELEFRKIGICLKPLSEYRIPWEPPGAPLAEIMPTRYLSCYLSWPFLMPLLFRSSASQFFYDSPLIEVSLFDQS